jgi:UvrD-like helicase C-terminal domain
VLLANKLVKAVPPGAYLLLVGYGFDELDELTHAYAVSIHRSQGSGYPCLVVLLITSAWLMLQRNLLYTAVTRASSLWCWSAADARWPKRSAPRVPAVATPASPSGSGRDGPGPAPQPAEPSVNAPTCGGSSIPAARAEFVPRIGLARHRRFAGSLPAGSARRSRRSAIRGPQRRGREVLPERAHLVERVELRVSPKVVQ